jgi:hypothetical protein
MCQQSDKLTLCSCEAGELPETNVWTLNRYVPNKSESIMGLAYPPYFFSDFLSYEEGQHSILNSLNGENCFDFPIQLKKNDVLTISLVWKGKDQYFEYRYTGKEWEIKEWQPFDLANHYKELQGGSIKMDKADFQ